MNVDDFETAVSLFIDGSVPEATAPPQKPLVGHDAIMASRDEGQGLTMMPQQGVPER